MSLFFVSFMLMRQCRARGTCLHDLPPGASFLLHLGAWQVLDGEWEGWGLNVHTPRQSVAVAIQFSGSDPRGLPWMTQWGRPVTHSQIQVSTACWYRVCNTLGHGPSVVVWGSQPVGRVPAGLDFPAPSRTWPLGPTACGEEGKGTQESVSTTAAHSVVSQGPWVPGRAFPHPRE